jgi:hypothetical protein
VERARDSEAAAMARVDANPVDAEQVAGEAERLVTWREQLNALRRRVRIYETTLAAIETAEGLTMRKATRFLEQQVGRDIARLTGGRYRKVEIDDRTLDIDVWAPERGDWVAANRLSKGTIDQIYLAARIGLVRLVTAGRRPPLVLDDPFVTFDDQRAARAALLLRELSSDFQVIYLACSNRYDGLADAVVELPGPTDTEAAATARAAAGRGAAAAGQGAGGAPADAPAAETPADNASEPAAATASAEDANEPPAASQAGGPEKPLVDATVMADREPSGAEPPAASDAAAEPPAQGPEAVAPAGAEAEPERGIAVIPVDLAVAGLPAAANADPDDEDIDPGADVQVSVPGEQLAD